MVNLDASGFNSGITNEGIIEMMSSIELNVWNNLKITDKGVKLLGNNDTSSVNNCHTLYLEGTYITDKGIKLLNNFHTAKLEFTGVLQKWNIFLDRH